MPAGAPWEQEESRQNEQTGNSSATRPRSQRKKAGCIYAAIMDLYGRTIVGVAVSPHNDQELVIEALKDAKR